MPILTLDHQGNLVESNPDRSDGRGYKRAPPMSGYGDVTLGNAALRSQDMTELINSRNNIKQNMIDHRNAQMGAIQANNRKRIMNARARADRERQTQHFQDRLALMGACQGMVSCTDIAVNPISGNGMTSDGTALPANPALNVGTIDPAELKQYILKDALFHQLCQEAQTGANMVAYDAANASSQPAQIDTQAQNYAALQMPDYSATQVIPNGVAVPYSDSVPQGPQSPGGAPISSVPNNLQIVATASNLPADGTAVSPLVPNQTLGAHPMAQFFAIALIMVLIFR
jgi:hypothetical protein